MKYVYMVIAETLATAGYLWLMLHILGEKKVKTDETSTCRWFGESWGAPANDTRLEIPVPVGSLCHACRVKFVHGDCGVRLSILGFRGHFGYSYYHRACLMDALGLD
jgi:hypothetical protein